MRKRESGGGEGQGESEGEIDTQGSGEGYGKHERVRKVRESEKNVSNCHSLKQVYLPCVLQTKKRYVGYMYETLDQKEPVFDAKGIETVRRDTCPAVAKVTRYI